MNEFDSALIQRDGESDFAYHRRLVYGKLIDKTLSDFDCAELAPYVYGKEYSADVARRMLYGSCKTLQIMDSSGEVGGEVGQNLAAAEYTPGGVDDQLAQLRREKQKFFDQRREYYKIAAADGRFENLCERLTEAAVKLNDSVGEMYDFSDGLLHTHEGDAEAVLVFSDWHYGMVASNIFNEYNTEICRERVSSVVEKAIRRLQLHACRKVHVIVLGDLFHGAIHTSARVASEELVCDQIMQSSEILAQSILRISQFVEEVDVSLTYGNHGRTVANKKDSIHRDNLERLVGWWLEQRLKEIDKIKVMPAPENEFICLDICGHHILASHGDLDSVKTSTRLLPTLFQKRFGKDIEYIILGDKHHRESFDELCVTASICGSLCGSDQFANEKRLYSEPSQMMLIINRANGVDAEYHIKC